MASKIILTTEEELNLVELYNDNNQSINSVFKITGYDNRFLAKIIGKYVDLKKNIREFTDDENQYILDNYLKEKTIKDISKHFKRDVRVVKKQIEKLGLEIKVVHNKIDFSEKEIHKMKDMYNNGVILENIAKEFDCTRPTIAKIIKNNGVVVNARPQLVVFDYELLEFSKYLINNEILSINHLTFLFDTTIPTLNKKINESVVVNDDLLVEKYSDYDIKINTLIKHSSVFKNIYSDFINNKNNNCRSFVETTVTKYNLPLATVVSSCLFIDENFNYLIEETSELSYYNMYYYENKSIPLISIETGVGETFLYNIFKRNNWLRDNTYSISVSNAETEIFEHLSKYIENLKRGDKKILNGKEIDILSESLKIGVEYNGLYFHSLEHGGKNKQYHINKTTLANDKGYKLVQIFEDEYLTKKELVLNKLSHIFGISENNKVVHARKCIIKKITNTILVNEFLNNNHIQGKTNSTESYGAYYNDELIAVMLFSKNSKFINSQNITNNTFELTRFCVKQNILCNGIANRLLKVFINDIQPSEIISFADRRWTVDKDNNLYTKLGFNLINVGEPNYYWCKNGKRYKSYTFKKDNLKIRQDFKHIYSVDKTEQQMMNEAGYYKIFDCGLLRYSLIVN